MRFVLRSRKEGESPFVIAEGHVPLSAVAAQSVSFTGHGLKSRRVHPVCTMISDDEVILDFKATELPTPFTCDGEEGETTLLSGTAGIEARFKPRWN